MMLLISKKYKKSIQRLILSTLLQKTVLILQIIIFLVLFIKLDDVIVSSSHNHINAQLQEINQLNQIFAKQVGSFEQMLDYIESDFQNSFIETYLTRYRLFGAARLSQYRFEIPAACIIQSDQKNNMTTNLNEDMNNATSMSNSTTNTNNISNKTTTNMKSIDGYSPACTPFYYNAIPDDLVTALIDLPLTGKDTCVMPDCAEFTSAVQTTAPIQLTTQNAHYPSKSFSLLLSKNQQIFTQQILNIKYNKWLDEEQTTALVLEFTTIDMLTKSLTLHQQVLEKPTSLQNVTFTQHTTLQTRLMQDIDVLDYFYFPLYIALSVLFIFRVMLFCTIAQSFGLLMQVLSGVIDFAYIIVCSQEIKKFQDTFNANSDWAAFQNAYINQDEFYNVAGILTISSYQSIFTGLMLMVMFFRGIQLLSFHRWSNILIRLINIIYRTMPFIIIYVIFVVMLLLGWGQAFHLAFRQNHVEFSSFGSAMLGVLFQSPGIEPNVRTRIFSNPQDLLFDAIYCFILLIIQIIIFTCFIALLIISFQMAESIELSNDVLPCDLKVPETIQDFSRRIDKFSKKHIQQIDKQIIQSNKMIVILDNNLCSPTEHAYLLRVTQQLGIKVVQFKESLYTIQFLQFLFRLKPMLRQMSGDSFRIIVQQAISPNDVQVSSKKEKNIIISSDLRLFEWLAKDCCRAQAMLYTKNKAEESHARIIKQIYNGQLIVTSEFGNYIKFASLIDINSFEYQQLQEQEDADNDSNHQYSQDEYENLNDDNVLQEELNTKLINTNRIRIMPAGKS